MNTERKTYCVNQIMKGEIIFERGSEAAYVGLVLKGRVRIQAEGVNLVIGSGHFWKKRRKWKICYPCWSRKKRFRGTLM